MTDAPDAATLQRCEQFAAAQGLRLSWRTRPDFPELPQVCIAYTDGGDWLAERCASTWEEAAEATERALLARASPGAAGRRERGR